MIPAWQIMPAWVTPTWAMPARVFPFLIGPFLIGASLLSLVLGGCDTTGSSPGEKLRYFEFVHTTDEDTFVVATSDPEVIAGVENQLAKPAGQRKKHINGQIARGEKPYNPGYPWHFVEGEWALSEFSTEVCDGRLAFVTANLGYWTEEVGRFCPWNSRVVQEVDGPRGR
jgi:hypothetical protein